jgi:hypothetical protein
MAVAQLGSPNVEWDPVHRAGGDTTSRAPLTSKLPSTPSLSTTERVITPGAQGVG